MSDVDVTQKRNGARTRILAIIALVSFALSLAITIPGVEADGEDDVSVVPEKQEQHYPNLGSHLNDIVAQLKVEEMPSRMAAQSAAIHREEQVAVTIYLSDYVDDVAEFLEDNGGDPRNVGEDYIEAYVPIPLLGLLSEQPGVLRVREIVPPQGANQSRPGSPGRP